MLYSIMTRDKDGALELRVQTREAHLKYLDETGVVVLAGPLLDEAGDMCGSLMVVDMPDLQAAQNWAANDPYAKAGLFAESRVQAWKKVIG